MTEPWHLARAERAGDPISKERLDAVLGALVAACQVLAAEIWPFLPDLAARIAAACDDSAGALPAPRPIFPRIQTRQYPATPRPRPIRRGREARLPDAHLGADPANRRRAGGPGRGVGRGAVAGRGQPARERGRGRVLRTAVLPGAGGGRRDERDAEAAGRADADGGVRPSAAARAARCRAVQRPRGARREHGRVGARRRPGLDPRVPVLRRRADGRAVGLPVHRLPGRQDRADRRLRLDRRGRRGQARRV